MKDMCGWVLILSALLTGIMINIFFYKWKTGQLNSYKPSDQ